MGHGKRLFLRAKKLRLQRLADPMRARLTLRIASARGLHGCRVGSSATRQPVYSPDLRSDESAGSYLKLSVPASVRRHPEQAGRDHGLGQLRVYAEDNIGS